MFMELPISGLHRLFHTLPSSSPSVREKASLESLTEETHTYDLLYPDYEALLNTHHNLYPLSQLDPASVASAATSYDDRSDLDIQSPRDVRILVAQDGNAIAQQPRVLYDSHPPPSSRPPSGTGSTAGRGKVDVVNGAPKPGEPGNPSNGKIPHSALTSKTSPAPKSSPSSPEHGQQSAFWSTVPRRNGVRSSVNNEETTQSRIARESREETDALLGCMFGHTGLPLVSSTKLHINPAKSTASQDGGASSGSLDLAAPRMFPKRRTPLTRSMTAEDFQGPTTVPKEVADKMKPMVPMKGPSILITRLFSVDLGESVIAKATVPADGSQLQQTAAAEESESKAKQIKIPKYGVAVLIQMPPAKRLCARLPPQRSRLGSSYEESSRLAPIGERLSAEIGSLVDGDSTAIDQDIERVVAHWSVLTRAVSLLEGVARSAISTKLQDLIGHDLSLSSSATNTIRSPTKPDARQKKYKQPSQRTIQLPSQSLQDAVPVSTCARETSQRVVAALKTRRVITGQGRWGVWREEARWVSRWAGGKEQNFFLFNLLTAFLGNHTEWLESLGRNWAGHRRAEKTQRETDVIRHRTVIVSADKMAARRLIFLLSAFLPCSYQTPQADIPTRPLSSRSSTGLSRSPPAGIPIPRERSLRRTINRKPRGYRTGSPIHLHERSISFTAQDPSTDEDTNVTSSPSVLGHSRRVSDARSIRSLALPIPTSNAEMRKGSTTTLSTLTPDCIAVPHFASPPKATGGTAAAPRPGSSGSLASLSLRRTLSRSESNGESLSPDSPSASRWGSMLSGFWSVRRGSSTDHTDPMGSPHDGLGISGVPDLSNSGKLAKMAEGLDTQVFTSHGDNDQETLHGPPSPGTVTEERVSDPTATAARDIPERPKVEEYPMKLSIDNNDGVVDIDLPASNSLPSSFDSSMSSPKIPNTASSSFNDHASTYGQAFHLSHDSLPAECPPAVDVAGYLKTYLEDFALQAVRPYKGLNEDVKASMRAEVDLALPTSKSATEVCTTLIADTTTFTISRLTLRISDANSSVDPKASAKREDEIIEEPLMDLDPTLISAVERVIGHSQPSSVAHSRAPSPSSRSKHHEHREHRPSGRRSSTPNPGQVSRSECRTLVLGALEKVAKSVSAEQQTSRGDGSDEGKGAAGMEPDSTLREGVRRWLGEIGSQGSRHG